MSECGNLMKIEGKQEKNSNEQRAVDSADRTELKTNDKTLCMGNKNKSIVMTSVSEMDQEALPSTHQL